MFGFAAPSQSRLGSIASRAAQLQSQAQQQSAGSALPPPTFADEPAAPAQPAPQPASPQSSSPQGQGAPQQSSVSDAFHWIANRFGGGAPDASAQSANPYADMNMTMHGPDAAAGASDAVNTLAGSGGGDKSQMIQYLASLFGA